MIILHQKFDYVRMVKSRMLACIVLQCRYYYLSIFLTISQPPDLTTEPATWHFNRLIFYYSSQVIIKMLHPKGTQVTMSKSHLELTGTLNRTSKHQSHSRTSHLRRTEDLSHYNCHFGRCPSSTSDANQPGMQCCRIRPRYIHPPTPTSQTLERLDTDFHTLSCRLQAPRCTSFRSKGCMRVRQQVRGSWLRLPQHPASLIGGSPRTGSTPTSLSSLSSRYQVG
jgi:hypothetical protein